MRTNLFVSAERKALGLMIFLFVGAVSTVGWVHYTDLQMRRDLLLQSSAVAGTVDIERVKSLTGTPADLKSSEYLRLKEQFSAIRAANPKCRFVYLAGRRTDGTVFFLLDVQGNNGEDTLRSLPGDVRSDSTPEFLASFSSGIPFVEGPVSDRWGTWISVVVPLVDSQTGRCIAVMGMDFTAREWAGTVFDKAAIPVALMLLWAIGLAAMFTGSGSSSEVPKPVLRRLLPILTLLLVVLFIVGGTVLWRMHRSDLNGRTDRMAGDIVQNFQGSLNDQIRELAAVVETLSANEKVCQALRRRDGEGLLADWRGLFRTLREENGIAHLYFADANRFCLKRIDEPEQFGDRIDQFTIREAEQIRKIVSGIDIGLQGTPVLRMVKPCFAEGDLVGYIGIGVEMDEFLTAFKRRYPGIELAIAIRKKVIDRGIWESARRLEGGDTDWGRLSRNVIIYSSQGHLPDVFANWLDQTREARLAGGRSDRERTAEGKSWHFAVSPLKTASGEEAGDVLILDDITALKAMFVRDMVFVGATGFLFLVTVLVIVFVLLRRTDAGIFAQQAVLRESEKLLSRAEELSKIGSWKLDLATDRLTWSGSSWRVLGVAQDELPATYQAFLSCIHSDDRDAVDKAYARSVRDRKDDHVLEFRIVRQDSNEVRNVLEHYVHERDAAGSVVQSTGMLQDVTELKRSENRREMLREVLQILNESGDLKESIRRILAVIKTRLDVDAVGLRLEVGEDFPYFVQDGFPNEFLMAENTLVHRDVNGCACRDKTGKACLDCACGVVLSGKTDRSNPFFSQGGSFWTNDLSADPDLPERLALWTYPRNSCLREGYVSMVLVPTRANDRIVGLLQLNDRRKNRFVLETIELLEGIAAHIGAALVRKWGEKALQESEARFKALHDASFGGIAIHDKGLILDCNRGLSEMTGYSIEELIGTDGVRLFAEQSRAMVRTNVEMGREKPYEAVGLRKNGEEYPLRVEARNIPYRGRKVRAVELRDITDQKQAEAKQKGLETQLAMAQKMESVGRLAGGVAHDFNNMLQATLGYTELALEQVPPGQPLHEDLEAIRNAAQHSAQLTQQLLAFARRQTVAPKVVDLNAAIETMLKILRRLIGEDVDLDWRPGADIWMIKIDPVQIDQILANLCVNARDAISGIGRIVIETGVASFGDEDCADRPELVPGDYVVLAVSDTGCGMDAETRSHIFEPFFSTKEQGKGTGLGLATVYGAVKQNRGFITVQSEPGHGTTFRIYLPRHAAEETAADPADDPTFSTASGSETILLVEDSPDILKATRKMLERLGYVVLSAGSAEDAIRLADENSGRIDLLLTDVIMPKMNGRDLAGTLVSRYPDLRCLFMSGYTADVILSQSPLNADDSAHFLQKPFSTEQLGKMLHQILHG